MRLLLCALAVFVVLLFVAVDRPADAAGLHVRWMIDYEGRKPVMFTYVDPAGQRENFWYVVYTLTNNGEIDAPLNVDLTIRDDRGRYYHMGFYPQVEEQIIAKEEHLTGLAKPLQSERIRNYKDKRRYMSSSEQRALTTLKVGESLQGIAVFSGVSLGVKQMDVLVAALINPVKYRTRRATTPEEEADRFELEPKIYRLTYRREGASLYPQFDAVEFVRKDWIVKNLGILSDKETIGTLVEALSNQDPTIRKAASDLLANLLEDRKGYNGDADVESNRGAILLWREWWSRNRHKLQFDDASGTFKLMEAAPAGGSN